MPIVQLAAAGTWRVLWSRDGKAIFYTRPALKGAGRTVTLLKRTLETGQETELVEVPWTIRNLALSPDGGQWAFAGSWGVRVIPAAGGESRPLFAALRADVPDHHELCVLQNLLAGRQAAR